MSEYVFRYAFVLRLGRPKGGEAMNTTDNREIRINGNGEIQRHPYNPRMNSGAWEPVIWYMREQAKAVKR